MATREDSEGAAASLLDAGECLMAAAGELTCVRRGERVNVSNNQDKYNKLRTLPRETSITCVNCIYGSYSISK